MKIDKAEIRNGELVLSVPVSEARGFVYDFKPGEYQIAKAKKKRSLDANAYAWVLINKIAAAVGRERIEVYRDAVSKLGGNVEVVCVKETAVNKLVEGWQHNGLGWLTEVFPSKIKGCKNVSLIYGSSVFDVHQMSDLLDRLIQDAKALDIETRPKDEVDALLNAWQ